MADALLERGLEQARNVLRQQRHSAALARFVVRVHDEVERSASAAPGNAGNYSDLRDVGSILGFRLKELETGAASRGDVEFLCIRLAALAARLAIEGDAAFPASVPAPASVPLLERI